MSVQLSVTLTLKDGETIEAATKRLFGVYAEAGAPTPATAMPRRGRPPKDQVPPPPPPDTPQELEADDDDLGGGDASEAEDFDLGDAEPAPSPAKKGPGRPPKAAPAKAVTYEEVCKAFKDYAQANGRDKAMKILERLGAPKGLKELKPDQYADALKCVGG